MSEMLSQAEIEALLSDDESDEASDGGVNVINTEEFLSGDDPGNEFSHEEIDALGEVGNISMGNSATTLFSLLSHKVNITTPKVTVSTLAKIATSYTAPLVVVRVEYTEGLTGSNLLVLKESDVLLITDIMMGGDGSNIQGDITELHLSAISEAMNQMIGTSSTSLSNVFDMKIDISPPTAVSIKLDSGEMLKKVGGMDPEEKVAVVSFDMTVQDVLETKIMQILPVVFAKDLISRLMNANGNDKVAGEDHASQAKPQDDLVLAAQQQQPQQYAQQLPLQQDGQLAQQYQAQGQYGQAQPYAQPQPQMQPQQYPPQMMYGQPQQFAQHPPHFVNVQPANFQSFDEDMMTFDKKNIGLVMDVQLEISVELGRTHRLIKDILEFGQGSIIELDKLAGEPVDVLVNGKMIAKGEVVVIDESFGVRVVDIIHPSKRI